MIQLINTVKFNQDILKYW